MGEAGTTTEISRPGSNLNLPVLLALMAFVAVFTFGALSWVRFYQAQVGNGMPARYFTQTDFPAVVIASRVVSTDRGAELYNLDVQLEEQRRLVAEGHVHQPAQSPLLYPYPYTPFIALLWSPLSELNPLTGMALWDIINILVAAFGLWYFLQSLPLPQITRLLFLGGTITSFPFIVNLEQGQSSGLVIGSLAVGIALLRRGKELPAGVVLGLLLLKVQWLPLIALVLLWKLRWRALLGMAITAIALSLVTFVAIGTGWIPDFLGVVARAQNFAPDLALKPSSSHSLSGWIAAILGPEADWGLVGNLHRAISLLIVVSLLLLGRGHWQPGRPRWDAFMALVIVAAMLTNVMLNTHDLSLLAIPAALGTACLNGLRMERSIIVAWYGVLWCSYLIPAFFLPQAFSLPLRPITLLMALMMVLLAVVAVRYRTYMQETLPEHLKPAVGHGLIGPF